MASTASAASKTTFRILKFSFRKKFALSGRKSIFFHRDKKNEILEDFFFRGDEKKTQKRGRNSV